jgi:hypothetical protein
MQINHCFTKVDFIVIYMAETIDYMIFCVIPPYLISIKLVKRFIGCKRLL